MGNHAVSWGVLRARAQVIAAYPITPQTQIVEELSEMCANGELDATFIKVESEHSAMACCIGAATAGARAFTATSAQGLALMHELLHWAAGARLPIVMTNVNRAMAPGWSIWADQLDSLSQRDTGWIQWYCESNQEVLDLTICAYKVAEQVNLPVMLVYDAFLLSHTSEVVDIPDQELVDAFLPPRRAEYKLEPGRPYAFGSLVMPEYYYEMRYKLQQGMEQARSVIDRVFSEWAEAAGRKYGQVESYRLDDAEIVLVTSGTTTSTASHVVDEYRDRGEKVGILKMRTLRPFPAAEVRKHLAGRKRVLCIDRNMSPGLGGVWAQEIRAATAHMSDVPPIQCYIAGLGGRDITPQTVSEIIEHGKKQEELVQDHYWIQLKE